MGADHDRNGLFRFRETHAAACPPARCSAGAVADDGNRLVVIDLRRRDPTRASGLIRESQSSCGCPDGFPFQKKRAHDTRILELVLEDSWRSVYADTLEVRPPAAPTTGEAGGDLFATGTISSSSNAPLGLRAEVTAAARCRGRTSVHPGNDALCRPRVLCVGWSERLLKDGLLNVDPIADRD